MLSEPYKCLLVICVGSSSSVECFFLKICIKQMYTCEIFILLAHIAVHGKISVCVNNNKFDIPIGNTVARTFSTIHTNYAI